MRRMTAALAVLAAAAVLTGLTCAAIPDPEMAWLRVAHLSPDAPMVDVLVDGQVVLEDVTYPAVGAYLYLEVGDRHVQVTAADEHDAPIIDEMVTLEENRAYTLVARGLAGDNSLAASVLEDSVDTQVDSARVRFAHMSPDAPAVDVAFRAGQVLFAEAAFPSVTSYRSLVPGTVDLEVREADSTTVVLAISDLVLQNDSNYTIFAIGQVADDSLAALTVVDGP